MIFSRISGTGGHLPGNPISNEELIAGKGLDSSDEWIRVRTGIAYRHLANAGTATSDLALEAASRALVAAGRNSDDIDLIIVATTTPDMIFPSTAAILQKKLLVTNACPAFDVQAVCSGFVYALSIADKFIRSGEHRCALVVGAEVFSKILDWSDRTSCVLFGDGAGAVILEASDEPGILASVLHSDGSHSGILSAPGCLSGGTILGDPYLRMDGQAVFKLAVNSASNVADEVLSKAGLSQADLDLLIPHQANIRIIQAVAKRLALSDSQCVVTVSEQGNTSAASVPLALDAAIRDGRLREGMLAMMIGVGGGFTWGANLIKL